MTLRAGRPEDAPAMAALVAEGFASYAAFAPRWAPPRGEAEEAADLAAALAGKETWSAVAEEGGRAVGFALVVPARTSWHAPAEPGVAHLRSLFVAETHHGTGVATALLTAAVGAARDAGYTGMRLFTPAGHARARRFYEREGFAPDEPFDDGVFGMPLVEYRRGLT